ncbi:hypothetical protein L249_7861 [Ophiocordyceps polyrhachis-furcata BCC 54312]|uniref:NAD(P)-binding domain-containing protein n=1 Tax=Ophiocordyceps polyrhachis-furcata BCC 54312 TaxID=1330021 RepID=A0A367L0Y4_9HYPO|nr:hypothetical protein L249_7861 [Ophiocordyceps polyrhachis-furcata BCC 54312]
MKLIVAGGTGFVGSEIIRQALAHPAVTSVVALARRETPVPPDAPPGKLKSVVCSDFDNYPEDIKRELAGADACVWYNAIVLGFGFFSVWAPQLRSVSWEQTCKICRDYALTGIKTLARLPRSDPSRPLRFVYISGSNAVRDPAKKPWVLGDYCIMRGDIESRVLGYARESQGALQVAVAKPGLIHVPDSTGQLMRALQFVGCALIGLPQITITDIAAALLDQAVNGINQETLDNENLARIGQKALTVQQEKAS